MTKEELEAEVTRLRNENLDIINKYTKDQNPRIEYIEGVINFKRRWLRISALKTSSLMIMKLQLQFY